jgi:hypothetical protein
MDNWPKNLKTLSLLVLTVEMLNTYSSVESFYGHDPKEYAKSICDLLDLFKKNGKIDPSMIDPAWFGPTGPIQEISISNGWGEVFNLIAAEIDLL